VVVVGDAGEAALADEVLAGCGGADGRVFSTAGRLTLSQLVSLCAAAELFVGNDSGPRHLAQAVGCATAGVFWIGNAVNGAPLTRARHRMQLSWTTRCPVCGIDSTQVGWTAPRCAHDPSFVTDVSVDAVWGDIRALLAVTATTAPPRDT
jgi:ADP-heptose:LPS heptosyltransferase